MGADLSGLGQKLELHAVPQPNAVNTSTSPQCAIKSPFKGPLFVLALAGIDRLVVHIKAIGNDDLLPLCGLVVTLVSWGKSLSLTPLVPSANRGAQIQGLSSHLDRVGGLELA